MLKSLTSIILFTIAFSASAEVNPIFSWQGNLYKKIKEYNKIHNEFSNKVCTPGTDFKYKKLLKNYKGTGHYLPLIGDDIDRRAISINLILFKKKINFISSIEEKLLKTKKLPDYKKISLDIKDSVNLLLEYKKQHFMTKDEEKQKELKLLSAKAMGLLKKQYDQFMNDLYFFKSFNYPNDHLANRFAYDSKKKTKAETALQRANRIFFYRKIVEDGAYEPGKLKGDIYTRSTMDTIYYTLRTEKDFISENLRHDLDWAIKVVGRFVDRGYTKQLSRVREWKKRTQVKYKFYKDIIQSKNKKKAHKIVEEKNKASIALKDFTYQKQAETYHFWRSKDRIWKALFSLETILYNEVGRVDGEDALERVDVAHIVMNRVLDPVYSSLDPSQPLVDYLKLPRSEWEKERWLNTLFRVGEFSFTYHYISSSSHIYCADRSRVGKKLRDKNLKISLKALKSPRTDFDVFRYFSRISMLGKIDMTTVWNDYVPVAEKPGYETTNQKKLLRLYRKGDYDFYYGFTDPVGDEYFVISISDKIYSMTIKRGVPKFYKYRNPHLFMYFSKK